MIKDPPLLTIRRHVPRLATAIVARFFGVATGHLIDALGGRGALDHAIKPIDRGRASFAGSALTCETGPSDNLAILAALSVAQPGDVIVAAADGFPGTAVIGDNVAAMARNRGVTAIVTDGMARDSTGIIGVGLPVFARGVTPNSCVRSGPGRIGLPVVVGGVAMESGDVVVGDIDGVVVVPRIVCESVLAKLQDVLQAEGELQTRIAAGLSQLDSIAVMMTSDNVHFLD